MYLRIRKEVGFVNINIVTTTADGAPVSPDADPQVRIYRVAPGSGSMDLDFGMGTFGAMTLSLVAGSSFLFAGALDVSGALFEQYALTISYSHGGGAATVVKHMTLILSEPDSIIYRERQVSLAGPGTTFKAPPPLLPPPNNNNN
jgi:hypothetical protein